MEYLQWKEKTPTDTDEGHGCFTCMDKNCDGTECKKFLNYRIDFLKEQLLQAQGIRKQHLLGSIDKCNDKLSKL